MLKNTDTLQRYLQTACVIYMYTMYLVVEAGRVPTLTVRVEGVLHPDLLPIVRGRCPWHSHQQNVQHVHKRVPHSGRYSGDIVTTKLTKISQKSLFNVYLQNCFQTFQKRKTINRYQYISNFGLSDKKSQLDRYAYTVIYNSSRCNLHITIWHYIYHSVNTLLICNITLKIIT